ncbi:AAA family ATPase [Solirubrobacter ginsenosidimutans]|uniref:AAA family ATPase n=1 Tax=Solirubrobacter ginsenosidimutans TaxID=490573 RepID=A0A9X3MM90_9ACTN|nr:AAA family ATPase [Solirubrobacter ginsenosidimutans]MDA0158712.1 AAA family ATPase [Solirubrobacter ginsenosidimutans]
MLHASERTRITRLFLHDRTVIRKEPLGADAERRMRHELAMLERLRGAAGVAQLADAPRLPGSIVLVDVGGTSLVELAKPLVVDELVRLALLVARAVAAMHRQGVMHRDLAPANIVVADGGAPCLVDFALATTLAEVRPDFVHPSEIVGTLAYLAPEQTGRTGRFVDERADLYALGATLYELATGEPPFGSGDPLRLVHDHLARVPIPPARVNPEVPAQVSEIVMHLLEKEPDNRYQTAAGLVRDLEAVDGTGDASLSIGERDFLVRLLPPSRLVGRDAEVQTLRGAFEEALVGRCRGVLVSGAPGVGKTALAAEVRPVVASRGGWFVAGKFDQHRRDLEFDAAHQALRALGRVLLAEPEHELSRLRAGILDEVGANAGLLTAVVPEFAALLAAPPDAGDPLTAQVRAAQAGLAVLRAVASPQRPVVVFLDDLQWAGRTPLGFMDLVLTGEPIDGLLLVGAYRDDNLDGEHPLEALLSRYNDQGGVRHLRLANLSGATLVDMVAEMLHVDRERAAGLVTAIEPHTHGNPYDTVELLDALRRDGVLTATADGWRWDDAVARARLRRSEVAEPLGARIEQLGPQSRKLVQAMACLGGRVELRLLQTATGEPAGAVEPLLAPALAEGLLVLDSGEREAARFRHDRIRELVLDGLDPQRRRALQLAIARRLVAAPEWFAVAAEQYLAVVDEVDDPPERQRVVALLRRAADQARLIGDYARVNALLVAALRLVDSFDTAAVLTLRTGRHAALFSLGRLEEADAEYREIEQLRPSAIDRAEATAVQVRSLSHQTRFAEAVELGLGALRACGIEVPGAGGFSAGLDEKFDRLHRWLDSTGPAEDLSRRELSDPALLATSNLIDAVLPLGYFVADAPMVAWLAMEAVRTWIEHGPSRLLVGSAAHAAYQAGPQRDDYPAAYRALRRIVALGEAHGYEPGTSQARYMAATSAGWFEPIESGIHAAHQAREGLIAGGELAYGGYTYQISVPYSADCAPSLASLVAEIESGFAFLRRTGNEQTGRWLDSYQWLAGVLGGEVAGEAVPLDRYADDPTALIYAHLCRAIAAAIFGDAAGLAQHSAAAIELLPAVHGFYVVAQVRLLRGLAVADEARGADAEARDDLIAELDELARWLGGRAAHAPDNFLHLLRLIEAERAWAVGDFGAAVLAFDAARREAARRQRPWHAALIAERAARFYRAHDVEQAGDDLLAEARRQYLAWGATAKVAQIDWAHPPLRNQTDAAAEHGGAEPADLSRHRSTVTTGTIDLLGILSASQALSSETSIERLHARVVEVLGAMTGATGVHLLLWSDALQDWLLPASRAGGSVPAHDTDEPAVPMSVLRYVQRTREPLVVRDAVGDDRFTRDPYFAGLGACSVLAVPIVSRGTLQALLVLENRLIRDAFTTQRLDAVKLIAGQLAVSLDNTQLYADYRRIADEQAALRRVATLVAEGPAPTAVFDAVATEMQGLLDADGVTLGRYEPGNAITVMAHRGFEGWQLPVGERFTHDGDSVTARVRRTGRPARMEFAGEPDAAFTRLVQDLGVRAGVGAPIVVEGRLWGIAVVYWTREQSPPADSVERIDQFAKLLETAIANADSRDQLIASRARLLAAGDEARRRVVRDLHDGAQQRLINATLTLKLAQRALQSADAEAVSLVGEALEAVEQGNEEIRELAHGMHPVALTRGGLHAALSAIAARLDVPVDMDIPDERFPAEIEASAYFIVAEALTNTVKHAQATRAQVSVSVEHGLLRAEIRDDGIGGADQHGHGLVGMSDRVAALRGRFALTSPPGAGTLIVATLPIAPG